MRYDQRGVKRIRGHFDKRGGDKKEVKKRKYERVPRLLNVAKSWCYMTNEPVLKRIHLIEESNYYVLLV